MRMFLPGSFEFTKDMAWFFLPSVPSETTEPLLFSSTPLQEKSNGSSWFQIPCDTSMGLAPGPLPQLDLPDLIEVLKQEETDDRGCNIAQSLHESLEERRLNTHPTTTEASFLEEFPDFELESGE